MAKVYLKRPTDYFDAGRGFKIFLDGNDEGFLYDNNLKVINSNSDNHILQFNLFQFKTFGVSSKEITIDISDNKDIWLNVTTNKFSKYLNIFFLFMFFNILFILTPNNDVFIEISLIYVCSFIIINLIAFVVMRKNYIKVSRIDPPIVILPSKKLVKKGFS